MCEILFLDVFIIFYIDLCSIFLRIVIKSSSLVCVALNISIYRFNRAFCRSLMANFELLLVNYF